MRTRQVRIKVQGMTCDHCEVTLVKALRAAGASEATADFRRGEGLATVDEGFDTSVLADAVHEAGYRPGAVQVLEAEHPDR